MRTFVDIFSVERDARWRLQRVAIFFEMLFAIAIVALFVVDRMPRRPRLECVVHRAQTQSHYPHPFGDAPPVEWTTCVWR